MNDPEGHLLDTIQKLKRERNQLLSAAIKLRDCKGRFHSEQAAKELFELANLLEKKSCGESIRV